MKVSNPVSTHSALGGVGISDHHVKYTDAEALTSAKTAPLDTLAAPTDITTLNATTALHGLLAKLSNDASQYMDGTGNWTNPTPTAPVFDRVVRTAGDITTTSTTLVDVTGASVTFTTGAFPVAYSAIITRKNSVADEMFFNVAVDGALELGSSGMRMANHSVGDPRQATVSGLTAALTAASHTIKLQWKVSSGTGTIFDGSAAAHMFSAHEVR